MSEGKKVPKKKLLMTNIKLGAPLIPILGIAVIMIYLPYSNLFMVFLHLWLGVLDVDLIVLYHLYLEKYDLRSPATKMRFVVIKKGKLVITISHVNIAIAYIFTAMGILGGGLVLAAHLIYQGVIASGLTIVPVAMTSQEATVTLLLTILLFLPAYFARREFKKVVQLMMKNPQARNATMKSE
jgi:hypothetical protein